MPADSNLDIIHSIFEHRLHQDDLDRILKAMTAADRNELVEKIGDLLRRISALIEVSHKVSDTLSLDVLLPRLMEIITDVLGADRSSLFLYDSQTRELFSRVAQGDSTGEIRFPCDRGIAGAVFTSGEPVFIPDAYADPRFNPEVDRKTGYRTRNILCAPLHSKNQQIIGVTQVLNKLCGDFDTEDLTLLDALTSQAASALINAQLFERVERARHEESRLFEITNAISSELQLEALLAKIVGVTTEMLLADRSTLFMFDASTNELWSRIAEGVGSKEIRFPATAGLAGACLTSGQVINIPDPYSDPRFNPEVDRKTGYRTRSILCMPVLTKSGKKLGVMQVLNKTGGAFTADDERRLKAFTAQASIALENAQLFEDVLNARNYNESILKSLSNGVITLDADRNVIKVNEAAARILQLSAEEAVGKSVRSMFEGDNDWIVESIDRVVGTGEIDLAMDTEILLAEGQPVSVNLTVAPLIDIKEQAIGYMLILEDISREKRVKSTMARYMTKEVVDKLLEGGESALGGSAQEVTILFSDIRGFTPLSEKLGARETVSLLNEYFSDMVEVIFEYGGILDKYIGDAIMALFGAPFRTDRDTDNAVMVANEMMRALRRFNLRREDAAKMPVDIGVGISTGEVVAGNIGSPKRMDYTVIGDSVNLASRLEGANKYYGTKILVCELAVQQMHAQQRLREVDLIRVKGQTKPIAMFEALDYHSDETFPNMAATLAAFEKGVARYRKREWQSAIDCFAQALQANPNDAPSQLYIERCEYYLADPPDDSWDGIWTMKEK